MTVEIGVADPTRWDARRVAAALETDPAGGLSGADAAGRLARFGSNRIEGTETVPQWRRFLAQFKDPLVYLLFVAIVISTIAWIVEGAVGWPVDASVIAAIVVVNAVLGFIQEARAERAVRALARMGTTRARVLRDGRIEEVAATEVVPGDVLLLAEGDAVAADGRLFIADGLTVAEASLTGESEPVPKIVEPLPDPVALADRVNMIFSGSAVTAGSGRAIVTATGMRTELGRIAVLLHRTETEPTPLQREIAVVGRTIGIAVSILAAVVLATVLFVFGVDTIGDLVDALLLAVSLAVAAVPEGLPAVLSVVLALGLQRMASQQAIVKRLMSVETLGSASVICTDKTGTLTRNEMTVSRVITTRGEVEIGGVGYRPEGRLLRGGVPLPANDPQRPEVARLLRAGCVANNAVLQDVDGDWQIHGDPTEVALLVAGRKVGIDDRQLRRFRRIAELPFSSERKMMSVVAADDERDGRPVLIAKGAPDVLLDRCTRVLVDDHVLPMDADRRALIEAGIDRLTDRALRALGAAVRELDPLYAGHPGEELEQELTYLGTVGMIDPPRPEAVGAVAEARRAGIRVMMITGDHPRTAVRIAVDLGIAGDDTEVLSGTDVDRMTDEEFGAAILSTSVFARVSPQHKLRIVDALQAAGHVVAMTGDGVNDAPALRSADIGVAMGRTGTEVAKEAATMILADDDFATIVKAVHEGRVIFANIRKFLRYLLSSNVGEVMTVLFGIVTAGLIGLSGEDGLVAPLLATQILWINLLTDSGPALALGIDPAGEDVMTAAPRRIGERVLDLRMWIAVLRVGLIMALATLITIDLYLPGGLFDGDRSVDNARTAAFTVLVLAQLFNTLNARSPGRSAFRGIFVNRWLWLAIGVSVLLQVAVVHVPFLNTAFGTAPLTADQWAVCLLIAGSVLWVDEVHKIIRRRTVRGR